MKDADEYDRLWRSGAFEPEQKPHQPTPAPQPGLSKSGEMRRNLLIAGGVIGVGILAAIWNQENITKNTSPADPSRSQVKLTEAPKPISIITTPTATPHLFYDDSYNGRGGTYIDISKPVSTPRPAQAVRHNPAESLRPTATPRSDPADAIRHAFPNIHPSSENRPKGSTSLQRAREIMGGDYLGPEAILNTFRMGMNSLSFPPVPFDTSELERAKELQQFLILRTGQLSNGENLTILKMEELLQKEFTDSNKGWVLKNTGVKLMYKGGAMVEFDTANNMWALVSKSLLTDSIYTNDIPGNWNKNSLSLLSQVQAIARQLKYAVFNNKPMPEDYNQAIHQYDSQKSDIIYHIARGEHDPVWRKIYNLEINKFRHRPVEAVYDLLMFEKNHNQRILLDDLNLTIGDASAGAAFVPVGRFNPGGILIGNQQGVYGAVTSEDQKAPQGILFTRS